MTPATDHARGAYEAFAPFYDQFTAHHDYEAWTRILEDMAIDAGLRGRRLLDVACGTGKSFLPFLARGYEVTGVDVSPAMLARARAKAGEAATLAVHDMRELPRLGQFDLVCCLDDGVNYLLSDAQLRRALAGMRRNLAADGVLVFDVNTLLAYRSFFARASVVHDDDRVLVWEGRTATDAAPGALARAELLALQRTEDGWWTAARHLHHQRHHDGKSVRAALASAGLPWVRTYGMQLDGSVTDGFDELASSKAVYIARRGAPDRGEGR